MIGAKDLRGLYAIIPTPALPNGSTFGAQNTVDVDETARLVDALIRDGTSGLIVLGTTGECATLSGADYKTFAATVLEVVNRRIPTFVGTSALAAQEVALRMDMVKELGADGTLLGLPMWQPMTTEMAVEFYRAASEYRPDLAIMVYPNARAFRYTFPVEFWQAVAKAAPTVVAAKASRSNDLEKLIASTEQKIHFMPIDMQVQDFYRISPATTTACWATAAAMGPAPAVAIMNAVLAKDAATIKALAADIAWANEPIVPILSNPDVFAQYNIQIEKSRITAAGYCNPGPVRAPYHHLPKEYDDASKECGRRWAALCRKLTQPELAGSQGGQIA